LRGDSGIEIFEVLTALKIQVEFLAVMLCSVVVGCQFFRGPCCLHLQGGLCNLVSYHNTTGRHNLEDLSLDKETVYEFLILETLPGFAINRVMQLNRC
jgi:hypothetical protein